MHMSKTFKYKYYWVVAYCHRRIVVVGILSYLFYPDQLFIILFFP